jgi:hypothetical protein
MCNLLTAQLTGGAIAAIIICSVIGLILFVGFAYYYLQAPKRRRGGKFETV